MAAGRTQRAEPGGLIIIIWDPGSTELYLGPNLIQGFRFLKSGTPQNHGFTSEYPRIPAIERTAYGVQQTRNMVTSIITWKLTKGVKIELDMSLSGLFPIYAALPAAALLILLIRLLLLF